MEIIMQFNFLYLFIKITLCISLVIVMRIQTLETERIFLYVHSFKYTTYLNLTLGILNKHLEIWSDLSFLSQRILSLFSTCVYIQTYCKRNCNNYKRWEWMFLCKLQLQCNVYILYIQSNLSKWFVLSEVYYVWFGQVRVWVCKTEIFDSI